MVVHLPSTPKLADLSSNDGFLDGTEEEPNESTKWGYVR